MSLGGILLGVINVAIVVVVMVLIGAVIVMFANWMQWPIDWNVQRLYLLVVALIALYLIVALLLGLPGVRIIGHAAFAMIA
jgi:predicted ABC-type exoprotein transport system permease subunit